MTSDFWTRSTHWIEVSIVGLVLVALQGPLLAGRRAHALKQTLQENGPGQLGERARGDDARSDPLDRHVREPGDRVCDCLEHDRKARHRQQSPLSSSPTSLVPRWHGRSRRRQRSRRPPHPGRLRSPKPATSQPKVWTAVTRPRQGRSAATQARRCSPQDRGKVLSADPKWTARVLSTSTVGGSRPARSLRPSSTIVRGGGPPLISSLSYFGEMFWLIRKKLSGSYFLSTSAAGRTSSARRTGESARPPRHPGSSCTRPRAMAPGPTKAPHPFPLLVEALARLRACTDVVGEARRASVERGCFVVRPADRSTPSARSGRRSAARRSAASAPP